MDFKANSMHKPAGKVRSKTASKQISDMNFKANNLDLLSNLASFTSLDQQNVNGHQPSTNHSTTTNFLNHHTTNDSLATANFLSNLHNLNNLSNSLSNLNKISTLNANHAHHPLHHINHLQHNARHQQLTDHLNNNNHISNNHNKNAIASEFNNQSSLLFPNLPPTPLYSQQQQSSKHALSSNMLTPPNMPPALNPMAFHPYLAAAIQSSLLNNSFMNEANLLSSPMNKTTQPTTTADQQQQILMQHNLNSLGNFGSHGLNAFTSNHGITSLDFFNQNANKHTGSFSNQAPLDHLNQFNQSLNLLNETFLSNNLIYPNQLSNNNFNFNILNGPVALTPSPAQHRITKPSCKRPKLETLSSIKPDRQEIKKELMLDERDLHYNQNFIETKDDLNKSFMQDSSVQKFEELKVQTIDNDDKLEDEKKFSPDSSTEFASVLMGSGKQLKNHLELLNSHIVINNQSPIITSTKSSSSEHSTSPLDVQLHSSLNSVIDQGSKSSIDKSLVETEEDELEGKELVEQIADEKSSIVLFDKDESENELNNDVEDEEEDENSLRIDLNEELNETNETNDEDDNWQNTESLTNNTKNIPTKTEDLYSLISKKSFKPATHYDKEVSLDRMSFDEDEEDEDKSPINFKNLIDKNLKNLDTKEDEIYEKKSSIKSSKKRREYDANSDSANPWCIRRSERIFLHEALSSNSNNCLSYDIQNQDFKIKIKDLDEPQRVLLQNADLLYCGIATRDQLSGKICVSLEDDDFVKSELILTFDKLVEDAIKEIEVKSTEQLHEGRRVAVYWSLKLKYLYPGRIGKISDGLNTLMMKDSVLVDFDDGDHTKIPICQIRLLPDDFELKPLDKDEENSSKSSNHNEEKKVEKLKIKLSNTKNSDELGKKKKKKHSHSKDKPHHTHKHHHKRCHRDETMLDETASADDENAIVCDSKNSKEDEVEDDDWWSKVQSNHQWQWEGPQVGAQKKSKNKKAKQTFYNAIRRGNETIKINDCAVFLSTGKSSLPFIGRIVKMWQNEFDNMVVNVKWFYHPQETRKPHPKLADSKGALFESSGHYDDNDVQTISHKVHVLKYQDYSARMKEMNGNEEEDDVYYFSGVYDPAKKQIISIEQDVPMKK